MEENLFEVPAAAPEVAAPVAPPAAAALPLPLPVPAAKPASPLEKMDAGYADFKAKLAALAGAKQAAEAAKSVLFSVATSSVAELSKVSP